MLHLRRTLAAMWLMVPPLGLSAVIHTTDPDVGGIASLSRPATLGSVFVYAIPLIGAVVLCLRLLVAAGRGPALTLAVVASVLAASGLGLLQSRPGTWLDEVWTVAGGSLVVLAVLALAVLPAASLGWRLSQNDAHG